MITSFESAGLGSASAELRLLGKDFALDVLQLCQKVHDGAIDYRTLQPFLDYKGVEMFLISRVDNFAVVAVELDRAGDLTVVVLFAGMRGAGSRRVRTSGTGTASTH